MSIRDDMIQKVLGNPGKYSIQELQTAMRSGSLPAYVVVPIIQDKVQQQKQMQAAMQQQQPPQSTVAEQVMQEADQMGGGVAQLPSNLPQEYSGGGVVALADGGDIEDYADEPASDIGSGSDEERQPTWEEFFFGKKRPLYESYQKQLEARRLRNLEEQKRKPDVGVDSLVAAAPASAPVTNLSAVEMAVPGMGGYEAPVTAPRRTLSAEETQQVIDQMRAKGMRVGLDTYRDVQAGRIPPEISAAKPSAVAPAAPPQRAVPPAAGPSIDEAGAGGAGVRGFGVPKQPELGMGKRAEQYATDFEGKFNEALAQWKSSVTAAEAKLTGKPLERFEAELEKEAREFGADKEQAKNMAIFKAGLAMMAGTSRHALENIGKGAMVGAEDYQKAASEIKKAQKENQRMFALVDQTRRAELAGNRDRAIGLATEAMKARTKLAEHTMNALTHGYGLDQKERVTMYDTEYKTAGTVAAANARLEGMLERLGMRGELSGAKTFDARTKIIQGLKDENFELKQYRDLIGNKNLKSDQLDAIKKDPKNTRIVAEVEKRRRNEIERRLSEGLGEYAPLQGQPVAGQPAAGQSQIRYLGVQAPQ